MGSAHFIEENIASDVTRMAVDLLHGSDTYLDIPRRTRAHDHDETFRDILAIARRNIPGELGERLTHEQTETIKRYLDGALHLMRTGARKLMRRFPGEFTANNQFWAIAEALAPFCKSVEFEGARYALRYGYGEARCEEIYDDEI